MMRRTQELQTKRLYFNRQVLPLFKWYVCDAATMEAKTGSVPGKEGYRL